MLPFITYFRSKKDYDAMIAERCEAMLQAIKAGEYQLAEDHLRKTYPTQKALYYQDKDGYNALHVCALKSNTAMLEKLVSDYYFDVNWIAGRDKPLTALQMAAERGDCNVIQTLVDCGGTLDRTMDQAKWMSPLHLACYAGKVAAVQTLLRVGAQIHALNTHGGTILHSIVKGHWAICSKAVTQLQSEFSLTPHTDMECNHYFTAKAVIEYAAEKGLKVKRFWV